ncbi:MAG: acetate--CoA ligase family protein [Myxococcales bacterium]|nr:acetate--CoA ligase family protein [Myxococcales bacterium]
MLTAKFLLGSGVEEVAQAPEGGILLAAMPKAWSMVCDCPELAVDVARDAERIGLSIGAIVAEKPAETAMEAVSAGERIALALERGIGADRGVQLAETMRAHRATVPVAIIGPQPLGLLHDLGLPAVHETGPMVAIAALLELPAEHPWAATTKELPAADRVRLGDSVSHRAEGRFIRIDDGLIAHEDDSGARLPIGTPRDVATALRAMRASHGASRPKVPVVQGVEADAVLDTILGPRRALSDPASKAALGPYDVPLPVEELCATPSRAVSEGARIGFPVRVALASPDLRLWDHPDLVAEVFSAAQARDAYRQIMALAKTRSEGARLLGVTVSASTMARTLLRVRMEPLPSGPVLAEIGFADPHGRASGDTTQTVLPATARAVERVLLRLRGSSLLLEGGAQERKQAVSAIGDVLMRLAAFVHQWRDEIEAVEVNPLAILVGGELEVRQACVTVGDAFSRSLHAG